MTKQERNARILTQMELSTKEALQSREAARALLIEEGIYRADGTLKAQFGGPVQNPVS